MQEIIMKKKTPKGYALGGALASKKNEEAIAKGKKPGSHPKPELAKKKTGPARVEKPVLTKKMIEDKIHTPVKEMAPGGKTKSGKLPMVEKNGRMVPFFAADGEGKMSGGGEVPKTKGYFRGGKIMSAMKSGGGTGKARGCGAARQQKFTKNG
jgi:hypothetical protein